jgi:hypothetical protein
LPACELSCGAAGTPTATPAASSGKGRLAPAPSPPPPTTTTTTTRGCRPGEYCSLQCSLATCRSHGPALAAAAALTALHPRPRRNEDARSCIDAVDGVTWEGESGRGSALTSSSRPARTRHSLTGDHAGSRHQAAPRSVQTLLKCTCGAAAEPRVSRPALSNADAFPRSPPFPLSLLCCSPRGLAPWHGVQARRSRCASARPSIATPS